MQVFKKERKSYLADGTRTRTECMPVIALAYLALACSLSSLPSCPVRMQMFLFTPPHPLNGPHLSCHPIAPPSGAPRKVTGLSQGPTSPNTRPGARIVKAYVGSVRRRREEMCQSVGVMEQWPSKRARPLLAMKGGCTRHERRQEWSKRIDSSYI